MSIINTALIGKLKKSKADKSNVLQLDNTLSYTPSLDYNPATKKYVDDAVSGLTTDTNTYVTSGSFTSSTLTLTYNDASTIDISLPSNVLNKQSYIATAGQTTFNIIYTLGSIEVFINGVKLTEGTDYSANDGTTVVLTQAADAGDEVDLSAHTGLTNFINNGFYTNSEIDNLLANIDALPDQTGNNGLYLTTNGTTASWAAVPTETTTTLTLVSNQLQYVDEQGTQTNIDLSAYVGTDTNDYVNSGSLVGTTLTLGRTGGLSDITVDLSSLLDEDARAIASGTLDAGTGVVTFTRDDATTFTVDLSALLDDTNLVTSVAGKAGVVTLVKADITDFSDADYATAAQGSLADSAIQPGDNVSTLVNDAGYITSETNTSLSLASNILTYTDETGTDTDIDLSAYLDNTDTYVTSGAVSQDTLTLTFNDASTVDIDISSIQNTTVTATDIIADSIQLTGGTGTQGTITWNPDEETIDLIQNDVVLQLGQEVQMSCINQTGATIPNATVVAAVGTTGASGRIKVAPWDASTTPSKYIIGITTEEAVNGAFVKVTAFGKVRDVDTALIAGTFTDGVIYADTAVPGGLTYDEPTDYQVPLAFLIFGESAPTANNGVIMVRYTPPVEALHDIGDVNGAMTPTAGQLLYWNDTISKWDARDEVVTSLSMSGNTLTFTDEAGNSNDISLAAYLDDTTNTVLSASLSGTTITFTREDLTTFTLDVSALYDDTNIVTSVNGQTGAVVIPDNDTYITSGAVSGSTLSLNVSDATQIDIDVSSLLDNTDTTYSLASSANNGFGAIQLVGSDASSSVIGLTGTGGTTILSDSNGLVIDSVSNLNGLSDVNAGTVSDGQVLTYNSSTLAWEPSTLPTDDNNYVTGASLNVSDVLTLTREGLSDITVDLSSLRDNSNLAYIASGAVSGNTLTLTRNDSSTIDIDVSSLLDDTNLVTSVNGQTGAVTVTDTDTYITSGAVADTTLTLTLNDSSTVDIDVSTLGFNGTLYSTRSTEDFTAIAGQTVFSTTIALTDIEVFYNGIKLDEEDYTVDQGAKTVTLAAGTAAGDNIEIINYGGLDSDFSNFYTKPEVDTLLAGFGNGSAQTTGTTSQVVDSWDTDKYRSAKYVFTVTGATGYMSLEMLCMYNDLSAINTQYAEIGANLGTFDTLMDGTNLEVMFTPVDSTAVVQFSRTLIDN